MIRLGNFLLNKNQTKRLAEEMQSVHCVHQTSGFNEDNNTQVTFFDHIKTIKISYSNDKECVGSNLQNKRKSVFPFHEFACDLNPTKFLFLDAEGF